MRLYLIKNSADIVRLLLDLDLDCNVQDLIEATVHLPTRGHIWIAVFTGPEPGRQVWRSTGLCNYDDALALAKKWEAQARTERLAQRVGQRPAAQRVRRGQTNPSSSSISPVGPLTQAQVAIVLKICERAVREAEQSAVAKLCADPELRKLWREYLTGEVEEALSATAPDASQLSELDVATLLSLTRSPLERKTLRQVLDRIRANHARYL
jgi:hypothetical protein